MAQVETQIFSQTQPQRILEIQNQPCISVQEFLNLSPEYLLQQFAKKLMEFCESNIEKEIDFDYTSQSQLFNEDYYSSQNTNLKLSDIPEQIETAEQIYEILKKLILNLKIKDNAVILYAFVYVFTLQNQNKIVIAGNTVIPLLMICFYCAEKFNNDDFIRLSSVLEIRDKIIDLKSLQKMEVAFYQMMNFKVYLNNEQVNQAFSSLFNISVNF